ncbi:hypothetical protein ANCDUO_26252 [Ancylostoma duodenale]|uniref:Tc1-like transposase DDE domain-containing protein n=1 Tax=Ancylostoma duodenale TaxID=51022 RepID=A0A0C2FFF6_9BILA|nr:hypothetical protein ANCDUO_26252 [Ancylostoma duodenale]
MNAPFKLIVRHDSASSKRVINSLGYETAQSTLLRLVQDNAPAHTSGFTKTKLKEWAVDVLQWPAESPDLNPIELVWGNMKNAIRKSGPRTLNELKKLMIDYWRSLSPEKCERYVLGVKKRLRRVVERAGGNILEGRDQSSPQA